MKALHEALTHHTRREENKTKNKKQCLLESIYCWELGRIQDEARPPGKCWAKPVLLVWGQALISTEFLRYWSRVMERAAFSSLCLSTQRSPRSILCCSSLSSGNEPEASSWYKSLNLSGAILVVPALCLQTLSAQSTDKKLDKVHSTSQASLLCHVTESRVETARPLRGQQ